MAIRTTRGNDMRKIKGWLLAAVAAVAVVQAAQAGMDATAEARQGTGRSHIAAASFFDTGWG
ncbi:hypothetical protein CTZ27_03805 [Streptomyces griseocarneus]|nr:hypothetical protein CTZ27_03805 [Streptomyces griseocarneus]